MNVSLRRSIGFMGFSGTDSGIRFVVGTVRNDYRAEQIQTAVVNPEGAFVSWRIPKQAT